MPVLYVFGQQPVDIEHCKNEFDMFFPDKSTPVIIMCDVEYSYAAENLTAELKKTYQHIIPTIIQTESKLQSTLDRPTTQPARHCASHEERQSKGQSCCGGNNSCARDVEDAADEEEDEEEDEHDKSTILTPSAPMENIEELKAEKKRGGRYFELPEKIAIEDCSIFFIGDESMTLTNIMMVHNKCPVRLQSMKKILLCAHHHSQLSSIALHI